MKNKTYKFEYKDANRYWWYITLTKSGEIETEFDSPDFTWNYTLVREDKQINLSGEIKGQYDILPSISEIMLDVLNMFNSVAIGFAKDCHTIK